MMILRKLHGTECHLQRIVGKKSSCKKITLSDDVLDRFHCLKASDHSAHGSDHASLLTGRYGILWRRALERTSVAWALSRNVSHQLSLETDDPCM